MTTITLAKTAGFCFGVNKAVARVAELLDSGHRVCTLGPIIHNPQVVESFASRGVRIVSSPAEVQEGETMVIRSHGVPQSVYEEAERLGINVCDATCPFVSKIHRLVHEHTSKGAIALIAGDEKRTLADHRVEAAVGVGREKKIPVFHALAARREVDPARVEAHGAQQPHRFDRARAHVQNGRAGGQP